MKNLITSPGGQCWDFLGRKQGNSPPSRREEAQAPNPEAFQPYDDDDYNGDDYDDGDYDERQAPNPEPFQPLQVDLDLCDRILFKVWQYI